MRRRTSSRFWHAHGEEREHAPSYSPPSPKQDDWRDAPDHVRTCVSCGRTFQVTAGEVTFAEQHGVALPTACPWHRPTRCEQMAMAAALKPVASLEPAATKPRQEHCESPPLPGSSGLGGPRA